jgi:MYXO-CTERM domain-containing protein
MRTAIATAWTLVAITLVSLLTFVPRTALAAGTFQIQPNEVQENRRKKPEVDDQDPDFDPKGEWSIRAVLTLPKPPPTPDIAVTLYFSKTTVYERVFEKPGEEPKMTSRDLGTALSWQVPTQAGEFAYLGKPTTKTIWTFDLKRNEFFEAGEYRVKLMGPDGQIGQEQTLKLKGINKKIYRGAMDFTTNVKSGVDAGTKVAKKDDDDDHSTPAQPEIKPEGTADSMFGNGEKTPEEEVKQRPHGCGCAIPGGATAPLGAGVASLALGLAFVRRRRRG